MPKNKEALIRYRVINRSLKDYGYVSKKKLIQNCENALDISPISERTIDADLYAMRYDNGLGYYAPIKYHRTRKAYYYEDTDYSIDKIPLNEKEIRSLAFAATLLDQFKEVELFSRFTGSVQKIIDAVNILQVRNESGTIEFVDFEKVPFVKGSEHLDVLIKAIMKKRVIHITYRAFHSEKDHHHDIHPYILKEYRNRWYLVGFHDYFRAIRIYGLDRIVKIEKTDKEYINSEFSPEQYFKHTIGIFSPGEDPPEIVLQFNKEIAQYFITQPIHESQKVLEENNDSITFSIKVHPTAEMIQLILGWGSYVKVISPKSLQLDIKDKLLASLKLYEK